MQGTAGYDFADYVNAVFVERRHDNYFSKIYRTFTLREANFEQVFRVSKRQDSSMGIWKIWLSTLSGFRR